MRCTATHVLDEAEASALLETGDVAEAPPSRHMDPPGRPVFHAGQGADALLSAEASTHPAAWIWSIWSRIWRVDGKPIECREMLKNDPIEDLLSYMAILPR